MGARAYYSCWIGLLFLGAPALFTLSGCARGSAAPPEAPVASNEADIAEPTEINLPSEKELAVSKDSAKESALPAEPEDEAPMPEERLSALEPYARERPDSSFEGGVEGGVVEGTAGVVVGGVLGGVVGGAMSGVAGAPLPPSDPNAILSFGAGMNRPVKVAGKDPVYPPEAKKAGIEGLVVLRCTIRKNGTVDNCRVIKSLPYLTEAALAAVKGQRFTAVLLGGQPVNVDYTFPLRFKLPEAQPAAPSPRHP